MNRGFLAGLALAAAMAVAGAQGAQPLRVWGAQGMAAPMRAWAADFRAAHPDATFEIDLRSTGLAVPGLCTGRADLGLMGRAPRPLEVLQFQVVHGRLPKVIEVATGGVSGRGASAPVGVFVHRDNPLAGLTLAQLDGIFGAARSGGWDATGTRWVASAGRGPEGNLRRWGHLGLQGDWADAPIRTYGFDTSSSATAAFFGDAVFGGGDLWNETLHEIVGEGGAPAGPRILEALRRDRLGIAIAPIGTADAALRALPLARVDGQPFVAATVETVAARSYPLARPVYVVFDAEAAGARAFAEYVLSPAGQRALQRDGAYLPLPEAVLARQREALRRPADGAGGH